MNPSLPGCTSRTRPKGHWPRWTLSSAVRTRSPTAKSRRGLIHFCRSCKLGKYSDSHLFQNTSARYWICFQRRWQYKSLFTKTPGGRFKCDRRSNKWVGVKGSASIELSLLRGKGRPFRIPSTSAINVRSASPETNRSRLRLCQFWSPKSVTMIKRIEGVQRRVTRQMLPNLTYNERLKRLDPLPLVYRGEVKDLSTFYILKSGNFNCSFNSYFEFCSDERLRSHASNKLKINRVRTEPFKGTFFNRIPYLWNSLYLTHWGLPTVVFLLLRDYALFLIKIGFSTLSIPMLPGLKSAVSKVAC